MYTEEYTRTHKTHKTIEKSLQQINVSNGTKHGVNFMRKKQRTKWNFVSINFTDSIRSNFNRK